MYYSECKHENEIINYLVKNGFDGLYNNDCGCGLDDLMPCGNIDNMHRCKPAKKYIKNNKCKKCFYFYDCRGYCFKPIRKGREYVAFKQQ